MQSHEIKNFIELRYVLAFYTNKLISIFPFCHSLHSKADSYGSVLHSLEETKSTMFFSELMS